MGQLCVKRTTFMCRFKIDTAAKKIHFKGFCVVRCGCQGLVDDWGGKIQGNTVGACDSDGYQFFIFSQSVYQGWNCKVHGDCEDAKKKDIDETFSMTQFLDAGGGGGLDTTWCVPNNRQAKKCCALKQGSLAVWGTACSGSADGTPWSDTFRCTGLLAQELLDAAKKCGATTTIEQPNPGDPSWECIRYGDQPQSVKDCLFDIMKCDGKDIVKAAMLLSFFQRMKDWMAPRLICVPLPK